MPRLPLLLLLLLHLLPPPASPYCILRQDCAPGAPGCLPRATLPSERAPFPLSPSGGDPLACPQYGAAGCCTALANSQLFLSFLIAQASLGEPSSGGCPACYANVAALWCAFACAPFQSDFLSLQGPVNVTNNATGRSELVLAATAALSAGFAGGVFGSCAGVGLVRGNPAMDTLPAFFSSMGVGQAEAAGAMRVDFEVGGGAPGALDIPALNCCSYPANATDPGGVGNATCPCASCLGMCPGGNCTSAAALGAEGALEELP